MAGLWAKAVDRCVWFDALRGIDSDVADALLTAAEIYDERVAVNDPHRRDRVWFVAHSTSERRNNWSGYRKERPVLYDERASSEDKSEWEGRECGVGKNNVAKNAIGERGGRWLEDSRKVLERQSSEIQDERPDWESYWLEVATELCRVDDGLPAKLDGFELTASAHRRERLKSLGNSIVPQVAEVIMRAIKYDSTLL